jgi:type I restriction enzyme S subunit
MSTSGKTYTSGWPSRSGVPTACQRKPRGERVSEVIKLKHVARIRPSNVDKKTVDGEQSVRLCNYTDVYYNDVIRGNLEFMSASATPDQVRQFQLCAGDVLITKDSETADDIAIPAFIGADLPDVLCGYHLSLIRPHRDMTDPKFLFWCMSSSMVRSQAENYAAGITRVGIRSELVDSLLVPYPPLEAQRSIAKYLDVETSRIDALIAKKRRMMQLLEERFESLIFHLIAGRHVDGLRRDSGLEWLGDVPAAWTIQPVGANFSVALGKMVNPEATGGDEPHPYLRNTNVKWDGFDLENLDQMHFSASDRRRCELRSGDLLVCEGGEVGRAAVWDGQMKGCFFQKAIHRVRPLRDGSTRFLMYCLRAAAARDVFTVEGNQSTIVHLTREKLRVHRFPYPDGDSQAEVVRRLDDARDKSRGIAEGLLKQIALLAEHRQALITAAVTGEIDVSGAAA